jgi:hypothetical protein
MPKSIRRLEAQLRAPSGRSSKVLKDTNSIEAVVEVPDRGSLTLSVQSGGGYSLRVHHEAGNRGRDTADRALVALGVLGAEEVVSVVPG